MTARAAAATAESGPRPRVAIFTTEEIVLPEAEQFLAPSFETVFFRQWSEVIPSLEREPADALLLDIDTVGPASNAGLRAMQQVREVVPDIVLIALTRSNSRNLRMKATQYGADEYFVAPVDFQELRIVLGRALEKRGTEIESRRLQEEIAAKESFCELIGGS